MLVTWPFVNFHLSTCLNDTSVSNIESLVDTLSATQCIRDQLYFLSAGPYASNFYVIFKSFVIYYFHHFMLFIHNMRICIFMQSAGTWTGLYTCFCACNIPNFCLRIYISTDVYISGEICALFLVMYISIHRLIHIVSQRNEIVV